jgi:endonuclease III
MEKSNKERAQKIFSLLKKEYPKVKSALDYSNAFELLIATILSAQSTDAGINKITPKLFKKYKSPKDYVDVPTEELENDIHSSGFYHVKARSIKNSSKVLVENYNGKMPETFEELNELPGVGRKTASVVVGNAYGVPAIAVDTHVKRLSNLLGFIKSDDPDKIETRLKELLPEKDWVKDSLLLAAHGRAICIARRPKCLQCVAGDLCPSFDPQNGTK